MRSRIRPAIVVVWAGRHRRDEWTRLCERYLGRIRHRVAIEELPVRVSGGQDSSRLEAEGKSVLAAIPDRSYVVALDSKGKQYSSSDLAKWLGRLLEGNRRPLVFVVGSDLGVAANVTRQADENLSFGAMTLPHELARVVLYEQLYRGLSILGGMKYHREPL